MNSLALNSEYIIILLCRRFGNHLQISVNLMTRVFKAVMTYTAEEHVQIQNALSDLATNHRSLYSWMEAHKEKEVSRKSVVIGQGGASYGLFHVFYYILGGFLPMMREIVRQGLSPRTVIFRTRRLPAPFFSDLLKLRFGMEVSNSLKINFTQIGAE